MARQEFWGDDGYPARKEKPVEVKPGLRRFLFALALCSITVVGVILMMTYPMTTMSGKVISPLNPLLGYSLIGASLSAFLILIWRTIRNSDLVDR